MKKLLIISVFLCLCVSLWILGVFTSHELIVNPDKVSTKNTTGTLGNLNAESSTALYLIDEEWRKQNTPDLSNLMTSKQPLSEKGRNYFDSIRKHLIDPSPQKSINALDSLSSAILEDRDVSRQEKMRIFWDIIREFGIGTDIGNYMLDILSELRPMEYLSEIIKLTDTTEPRVQRQVAGTIAKMFTLDPSVMEGDLVKITEFEKKRSEAQIFFQTQFAKVHNKDTLINLLILYPSVLTLDQALPNAIEASLEKNKQLLSSEEYARSKFNILSFQLEKHAELTEFLIQTTASQPEYRKGINEQLYAELAGPTADVFISNQTPEWKRAVYTYLIEQKPIYDGKNPNVWANEYGKWANANINLNNEGNLSHAQRLINLLDQSSPIEQIVVLDRLIKSQIPLAQDALDAIKNKDYINRINANLGSLSQEDTSLATQILPTMEVFRR